LIDNSNISSWRSQIAYVPQTIFLSEGTIAENIALGIPVEEINSSRIRWAAQQAKIDSFIEDLPGGYDSKVGESGIKISGGQRQRIAIARALYKSASIIILDEATSALDIQTEEEVMSAIGNLRGRITLFIITHRTSAMKGYDKIIKLESGTAKVVKII
jgi:ATP-binding cassette subfamily B protein